MVDIVKKMLTYLACFRLWSSGNPSIRWNNIEQQHSTCKTSKEGRR
jgi:hypothetical protein